MRRGADRRTRRRGSATVEYMIILGVIVLPFSLLCVHLGNYMVPYYEAIEYLNSIPMP